MTNNKWIDWYPSSRRNLTIDEITNYIMDEFVRGKITTSNIDTDEDDEMYTKIWNNINAMIYDDGR